MLDATYFEKFIEVLTWGKYQNVTDPHTGWKVIKDFEEDSSLRLDLPPSVVSWCRVKSLRGSVRSARLGSAPPPAIGREC
jgi:hypothetical protein